VIALHRLSGHPVIVNADLIEMVESSSDGETVVTLTTGNVLAVSESPEAVQNACLAYRRSLALGRP
jgi:uncharacterized protein YlzI (FlbEa/FlbD family)